MKTSLNIGQSLDWRSLVIGLLVGMVVLIASGYESGQRSRFMGRYIPISAGNSEDAIFIVDAYTGQTWRMDESDTVDYGIPELRESPVSDAAEGNR